MIRITVLFFIIFLHATSFFYAQDNTTVKTDTGIIIQNQVASQLTDTQIDGEKILVQKENAEKKQADDEAVKKVAQNKEEADEAPAISEPVVEDEIKKVSDEKVTSQEEAKIQDEDAKQAEEKQIQDEKEQEEAVKKVAEKVKEDEEKRQTDGEVVKKAAQAKEEADEVPAVDEPVAEDEMKKIADEKEQEEAEKKVSEKVKEDEEKERADEEKAQTKERDELQKMKKAKEAVEVEKKMQEQKAFLDKKKTAQEVVEKIEAEKQPVEIKKAELDTLDIEGEGNWRIKREALESAFKTVGRINDLFPKINDSRMLFLKSRNEIDKELDKFSVKIGIEIGSLQQRLSSIVDELEKERKEEGDLGEDEREIERSSQENIKILKNLQEEVADLQKADERIDTIMLEVEKQIIRCEGYRKNAWKNLESIKKLLNHEKAQELLSKTQALFDTMQAIFSDYLQGKLLSDFQSTIQAMTQKMSSISSEMQQLKSKGVDLQKKQDAIEKEEEAQALKRQEQEEKEAIEEALVKQRKELGFMHQIKQMLSYPVTMLSGLWNYLLSFIISDKSK